MDTFAPSYLKRLEQGLVLPSGIGDSREVIRFLLEEVSKSTCFDSMNQYYLRRWGAL